MIDFGRICAITFGDVAGSFLVGMILGAFIYWLVSLALWKGNRDD